MVDAVLRLTRRPALVASLAKEGSRLVEGGFRWDAIARLVEPVCRKVAAQGPRRYGLSLGGEAVSRPASRPR
jgi:hypothetical protein